MRTGKVIAVLAALILSAGFLPACDSSRNPKNIESREYEAYIAVMDFLEQDAKDYLELNTNYQFVRISEFGCHYIEPEPDCATIDPPLNAPHYLSYVCIIKEDKKIGSIGFGFDISVYVDNFVDLKSEIDKGVSPKHNYSSSNPVYGEDHEFYNVIAPNIPADVAPYVSHNPDLCVFSTDEVPVIVHCYTVEQTMTGNGDVTLFSLLLYYTKSKMAFNYNGYYVPQGVYYNKSKLFDRALMRRVSALSESHIMFALGKFNLDLSNASGHFFMTFFGGGLANYPWEKWGTNSENPMQHDQSKVLISNKAQADYYFGGIYSQTWSTLDNQFVRDDRFTDIVNRYDEQFFQSKQVITFFIDAADSGCYFEFVGASYCNGVVTIVIDQKSSDEVGACVIVPWFAIVEVEKLPADTEILLTTSARTNN